MEVRDLLRFLLAQLEAALNDQEHERISELGSAIEVFYEAAKLCGDGRSRSVLDRMIYVVFHYRDPESLTEMNLQEIARELA